MQQPPYLGLLCHHSHVSGVVGCCQHGAHDEGTALPPNGLNAHRGPLHLDPYVGRHAQVDAGPQQAKEQDGLGHNEEPHAIEQVLLLELQNSVGRNKEILAKGGSWSHVQASRKNTEIVCMLRRQHCSAFISI